MGTIYEKLNYLDGTKGLIREAINDKGGELTTNNTFREYVDAINNLETGGGFTGCDFTAESYPFQTLSLYGTAEAIYTSYVANANGLNDYGVYADADIKFWLLSTMINNRYFSIDFGDIVYDDTQSVINNAINVFDSSQNVILWFNISNGASVIYTSNSTYTTVTKGLNDLKNGNLTFKLKYDNSYISDGSPFIHSDESYFEIYYNNELVATLNNSYPIYPSLANIPCGVKLKHVTNNPTGQTWRPYIKKISCETE